MGHFVGNRENEVVCDGSAGQLGFGYARRGARTSGFKPGKKPGRPQLGPCKANGGVEQCTCVDESTCIGKDDCKTKCGFKSGNPIKSCNCADGELWTKPSRPARPGKPGAGKPGKQ